MGMYNKRTLSAIHVPFESRETYIFHIKARVFNGCLKVLMFLCFCKILDICVVIVWWSCLNDFCSGCWDCAIDCVTWVAFWCCFFPRWPSRPNAFGAPSAGGFNALIFLSSGMSYTKNMFSGVFVSGLYFLVVVVALHLMDMVDESISWSGGCVLMLMLMLRLDLVEFCVVLLILLLEISQITSKLRYFMSSPTELHAMQRLLFVMGGVVVFVCVIVMIVFQLLVLVVGS